VSVLFVNRKYFLVSRKLDTFWYLTVQTAPCYMQSFWHNTGVWQTDGQTDIQTDGIAIASTALAMPALRRTVKTISFCFSSQSVYFVYVTTPWVKKGCHPNHSCNFVNSWSICKILSLLQTAVNFQQNPYWVTHHNLSMLLHYLGKLKDQTFALCMHVKRVSRVIFYHLSKRYLPNVMKISAKINTMQNINTLLFVRSLSLRNWRNA